MAGDSRTGVAWAIAAGYAGLIFFFSSLSRPLAFLDASQKIPPDWLLHGIEYLLFGMILARALSLTNGQNTGARLVIWTVVWGTFYALTDEWHQSFVPERQASLKDLGVDSLALWIGGAVWDWRMRMKSINTES